MSAKGPRPLDPNTGNVSVPSFLKVKKLNEVVSYYMNDKVTHSLYKAISAASSFKNVKKRQLFEPHHKVPEVADLSPKEMDMHLKRLLEDGTVSQLAYLISQDVERPPEGLPCYAAIPETEALDLSRIYLELLDLSVSSLLVYLDRKPELNKALVWENMENDWDGGGVRKEAPFPQLFLYLRQAFQNEHFRITPNPEFVKDFLFELEDDLHKKGRVIDVPGYGLFGLKSPKEAVQILEYIDDFIETKGSKQLRYALFEEFQKIAMEEKFYYSNPSHPETTKFKIARAEAFATALPSGNPNPGSPGMLSVVLIRSLSEIAEKELQRQSSERDRNRFHDIKRNLLSESGSWEKKVLLVPDKEFKQFPEELKRMLIDDLEIGYSTWETKTSTIHSFFHKEANSVRQIILSLGAAMGVETWKILCIRQLVESNEPQIKSVFKEPDLVRAYGKVLRKGYMDYFPWYYSILDLLGIGRIFQDIFFAQAKEKIRIQQNQLKTKNHENSRKEEQAKVQEKIKEEERIRSAEQRSKISTAMDGYYFKMKVPPTAAEIQSSVPEFSPEQYYEILEREKFVFLTWEKGKERFDQILCYPGGDSFRNKARELHKILSEKLEFLQNKVRTTEEEDARFRITKVVKHVDEWFASNKSGEKSASPNNGAKKGKLEQEDPFESFRVEINKLRKTGTDA
ncbi:hypothetical protein EHQ53_05180 [Leptospira langatensis]|uniref:Uncharacterized protein n=1 Tax=Leptospira langatensis TaxID=2484983 RepID=A0A5F1ZVF7_9LEPT|nr:hypothetical protein [Leptospira langatensis]TGK02867.1 hypothetical protein EHO57_06015 [Leptospira langatensis]TGL41621.1 hypothetical protein EHQ53_05180 [Leptospira langatensis]